MEKRLAIDTNKHLKDPEKRRHAILRSVVASSRIEGVQLSDEEVRDIDEKVENKLKKRSK